MKSFKILKSFKTKAAKGMSLVEVLLAVATFALISTAVIGGIIYGVQGPAISGTRVRAQQLLNEGNEAVRNIRDSDVFTNLNSGTYIITTTGGVWGLQSITTPATESETIDTIFKRYLVINAGTDSRKVTVYVSWSQGTISQSINTSMYVTNWQDNSSTPKKRGLIVYNSGTNTTPYTREYDDVANTFGAPVAMPSGGIGDSFRMEMSPTKAEAIIAYVDNVGTLRTMCYDDSTDLWTQDWSVSVGGAGSDQRFVLNYETTTGDAFIAYTTNASGTNEMAYRTKPGASACGSGNWSAATNYDTLRTSGQIRWMIARPDRRAGQNRIYVAWSDTNNDLSAGIFNGSAMGSEPTAAFELNLEYNTAIQDVRAYDLSVESATGNAMLVWSPFGTTCTAGSTSLTASCIRYSRYTASWGVATTIPTVADRGTNIDITANYLSTSNQIQLAAIANDSNDLSLAYWSGTTWTGRANYDTATSAVASYRKMVACAWLNSGATTRSVITYSDFNSGNVDWITGNGATYTTQTDFNTSPTMDKIQSWVDLMINPNSADSLIYTTADGGNALHVKSLVMSSAGTFVWADSDTPGPLEANLSVNVGNPYSFSFWDVIPEV